MAKLAIHISDRSRELLRLHWFAYRGLDMGLRNPTTPAQVHFVRVCRGEANPETEHEEAYIAGRRLLAATHLSERELIDSGFQTTLRDIKDIPFETRTPPQPQSEHAVDVDRFSGSRRIVRKYNW